MNQNPLADSFDFLTQCCTTLCRFLALSVISLLRSDLVVFGCEADMRTVDRSNQSDVNDPICDIGWIEMPQRSSLLT